MADVVHFLLSPGFCEDSRNNTIYSLLMGHVVARCCWCVPSCVLRLSWFPCLQGALTPVSEYLEKSRKEALMRHLTSLDLPGKWLMSTFQAPLSPWLLQFSAHVVLWQSGLLRLQGPPHRSPPWIVIWLLPASSALLLALLPLLSSRCWCSPLFHPQPLLLIPWIILHTHNHTPQVWNHSPALRISGREEEPDPECLSRQSAQRYSNCHKEEYM